MLQWALLILKELRLCLKMTNKNPFEVRLDILKMAQEMMDREMTLKEQKFNHQVETLRSTNIGGVEHYINQNSPQMYSPDDIIAKAATLYGFVSDSSTSASAVRSSNRISDIEEKYRK